MNLLLTNILLPDLIIVPVNMSIFFEDETKVSVFLVFYNNLSYNIIKFWIFRIQFQAGKSFMETRERYGSK